MCFIKARLWTLSNDVLSIICSRLSIIDKANLHYAFRTNYIFLERLEDIYDKLDINWDEFYGILDAIEIEYLFKEFEYDAYEFEDDQDLYWMRERDNLDEDILTEEIDYIWGDDI